MKPLIIFTILFSTIACATPENKRDIAGFTYASDNRLTHYVSEFLFYCNNILNDDSCLPRIDLDVSISRLDDGILGRCLIYDRPSRKRSIEIDIGVIGQYNERAVVYHELFHCVTNKPHYDDEIDIMNTYEINEHTRFIYDNWGQFVKIVFLRK